MGKTRECSKSILGGKIRPVTHPYYSFRLYARAALAWTEEKCSLRNEKHKANRASLTEEQRKVRMKIRREKEWKTTRISAWPFSQDCSGVMKMSWREN